MPCCWPYDQMDDGELQDARDLADDIEAREWARLDRLADHAPAREPVHDVPVITGKETPA